MGGGACTAFSNDSALLMLIRSILIVALRIDDASTSPTVRAISHSFASTTVHACCTIDKGNRSSIRRAGTRTVFVTSSLRYAGLFSVALSTLTRVCADQTSVGTGNDEQKRREGVCMGTAVAILRVYGDAGGIGAFYS